VLVKKADKPRYWVTHLLKDLDVGTTFKPDVLHFTIVPWFVTEIEDEEIVKSFYRQFSAELAFDAHIGQTDEFKDRRKILINPVDPSPEILTLHQKTLNWLSELEARWAVKKPHVGPDYIPHIRRRGGSHNLTEGDVLHISSLSLIRAHRRGDDLRTVAAKVELQ
jgi:2'-5' RNA ligase